MKVKMKIKYRKLWLFMIGVAFFVDIARFNGSSFYY